MGVKPETRVVGKIMDRLHAEGGFWFKVHGGPFQMAGLPDILGCYKGRFIGIEVKCPGNKPTALQLEVGNMILKAGGIFGVAYSVAEAVAIRDNPISKFDTKI